MGPSPPQPSGQELDPLSAPCKPEIPSSRQGAHPGSPTTQRCRYHSASPHSSSAGVAFSASYDVVGQAIRALPPRPAGSRVCPASALPSPAPARRAAARWPRRATGLPLAALPLRSRQIRAQRCLGVPGSQSKTHLAGCFVRCCCRLDAYERHGRLRACSVIYFWSCPSKVTKL